MPKAFNLTRKPANRFNQTLTGKEQADARATRDWLDEQEDAEIEALILHRASQSSRSQRLEAYDR